MKFILLILIMFSIAGCFSKDKMQAIDTLRSLAKERSEQEKDIELARNKFRQLVKVVEDNTIEKDLSQEKVRILYGDPLFVRQFDAAGINRIFIYGDPIEYSGKEKVYLYFDENQRLTLWNIK